MVETRLSLSRFGLQMFWVRLAISGPQKETNENTLFSNDLSATSPMRPPFLFFFSFGILFTRKVGPDYLQVGNSSQCIYMPLYATHMNKFRACFVF